ncbi:hypothetical protein GCM10010360_54160 [Streptomyces nogalater]
MSTTAGPAAGSPSMAVFVPPHARGDQVRTRHAHAAAARMFEVAPTGPDMRGRQGRTLGLRAGQWWLRLICAPEDKRNLRLWEGTATAQHALPLSPDRAQACGSMTCSNGPRTATPPARGCPSTCRCPPSRPADRSSPWTPRSAVHMVGVGPDPPF